VQRKNAGIMLDTWHFSRGNPDFALLKSLPGECLVSVQVADARRDQRGATLFEDTVRFRKFPGEGELPIAESLDHPSSERAFTTDWPGSLLRRGRCAVTRNSGETVR
jgi:hypothetical protein